MIFVIKFPKLLLYDGLIVQTTIDVLQTNNFETWDHMQRVENG